ncbi:MAG: DDE-type integrase/transposase/recombinase [Roseobacter sp.]
MDAYSRCTISWFMANDQKAQLVIDAMNMTIARRKPHSVIHRRDQGSLYISVAFGLRPKQMGLRPSVGSVGGCFENAMCERFFVTLNCELLDRH